MIEYVRMQATTMQKINDLTLPGEIVIFGSTYMSNFPMYELVNKSMIESAVYNRSIRGLTVRDALEIVDECVISLRPGKIFVSLGEEDENTPNVISLYNRLIFLLRSALPECELYLIGLTGTYTESFNQNLIHLCDGKKVRSIHFTTENITETELYKVRFKQLSCYFRRNSMTISDAVYVLSI